MIYWIKVLRYSFITYILAAISLGFYFWARHNELAKEESYGEIELARLEVTFDSLELALNKFKSDEGTIFEIDKADLVDNYTAAKNIYLSHLQKHKAQLIYQKTFNSNILKTIIVFKIVLALLIAGALLILYNMKPR